MRKKRELTPFGMIVKKALIEKRMTQVQLAEEIGTTKKYLNLIPRLEGCGILNPAQAQQKIPVMTSTP